jgi:hypothetical protein
MIKFPIYYQHMLENPEKVKEIFSDNDLDNLAKAQLSAEEQDIFTAFYQPLVTVSIAARRLGWKKSKVDRYIKRIEGKIGMTPSRYWGFRNQNYTRK